MTGTAWIAPVFVWGVWLLMLAGNLALVGYGASTVPIGDELGFVPYLVGEKAVTLAWLWEQHAEHRVPLAKLIWVHVLWLTNYDFRSPNYLDVLATGAVAFATTLAARRIRGWTSYTDAFFPLTLLTFGQAFSFLWWWQTNHVLGPLLASVLLLFVVPGRVRFPAALGAGVCLVLLALSGPGALPFALALAPWLASGCIRGGSSAYPLGPVQRILVLALVGVAVLLVGAYFVGYDVNRGHGYAHGELTLAGLGSSLQTSLLVLSLSLGPALRPFGLAAGAGVAALWAVSSAVLVRAWYCRPPERPRACGLLLFLTASGVLALALGWARTGFGEDYLFSGHFTTKAVPALCCVYFIWEIYGRPAAARAVQTALFAAAYLLVLSHGVGAFHLAGQFRSSCQAFEQDLQAGVPVSALLQHRAEFAIGEPKLTDQTVARFRPYYRMLMRAGIGPFQQLRDDPTLQDLPVPLGPADASQGACAKGLGRHSGPDAFLTFRLERPAFVYAIRLRCSCEETAGPTDFRILWKRNAQDDFSEEERCLSIEVSCPFRDQTLTLYVNDTVTEFRIRPGPEARDFTITEVVLQLPATTKGCGKW